MLDSAAVQEMVQACLDRFKRIDILVNNVGGSEPGSAETMSEEAWDRQIDFNLKTAFLGCKHVLPVMVAQGRGAIVNTASVAGLRVSANRPQIGYTASKSAVIGLTKSVAATYAKQGIRCNTVMPGLMHTPLVEYRLARQLSGNDAEALIAKRNAQVPMGRMGTGWDVANATLFLVSDEANFITGTEIVVDGGFAVFRPGRIVRRTTMTTERFRPLTPEEMTPEQKAMVDAIQSGPRGGGLRGPFKALMRSPELGDLVQRVGAYVRYKSSIPADLNELAIILAGRKWNAQYEFYAHRELGLKAGMRPEVADAVAAGKRPDPITPDEAVVYDFCHELLHTTQVSDAHFNAVVARFGEQGVIDLVGAVGYYSMVSMILNVDRVQLPAGVEPLLKPL